MSLQSSGHSSLRSTLKPGLNDPIFDAQAVFRAALLATAYPGRTIALDRSLDAPKPLDSSTALLCLALMDFETPVWLDQPTTASDVPNWLRFHCGLPIAAEPAVAGFALITNTGNVPHLHQFHPGELQYPDRSATVIIQLPALTGGPETIWAGPGIRESTTVGLAGLPSWFWSDWELNAEYYPLGVDVFFTSGNALIALPRTIKVEA
ncbi:phosphonate C-P lyase system protein PhnH [Rhizobium mongolense]|uniref:Alpha-D-ribose 1-methylphosphonate 5-triphosphate synthase subunit PhnH n=2 Tax=Rhizobium mongolense TaxID=57676 RepID=A0ABR6IYK8_9HYPH|nr:phosphonate C-P lyase system protein PhnH [Rhizobium mongolense]MBB4232534.1 alpha-D-ribose 1-methylphosphonate 5-triphosphate synthase subunit PhnH [Rhizobium mongolense]TVZ75027.1 alpha-D-ribose 1-methylphosphonate 5-triphosphate synthase subunit PhnH [Rhizobium mongolense USDA 1844]